MMGVNSAACLTLPEPVNLLLVEQFVCQCLLFQCFWHCTYEHPNDAIIVLTP